MLTVLTVLTVLGNHGDVATPAAMRRPGECT